MASFKSVMYILAMTLLPNLRLVSLLIHFGGKSPMTLIQVRFYELNRELDLFALFLKKKRKADILM